tara:strand:- start:453 stop:818 length:366 start_codon:yes stop_codon:yes gene_type:complete
MVGAGRCRLTIQQPQQRKALPLETATHVHFSRMVRLRVGVATTGVHLETGWQLLLNTILLAFYPLILMPLILLLEVATPAPYSHPVKYSVGERITTIKSVRDCRTVYPNPQLCWDCRELMP